ELRIVRIPAPGGTASQFPFLVLPSLKAGVFTDGLLGCAIDGLIRVDQDVSVGAYAKGSPREFAGFQVVGRQMPTNAILASRNPDNYLVVHYQRSRSHRLTQLGVSVLGAPNDFAGLRIEGV